MTVLAGHAVLLSRMFAAELRDRVRGTGPRDRGFTTLEMVILGLGLMAIAGMLVAAFSAAVSRRTSQIR